MYHLWYQFSLVQLLRHIWLFWPLNCCTPGSCLSLTPTFKLKLCACIQVIPMSSYLSYSSLLLPPSFYQHQGSFPIVRSYIRWQNWQQRFMKYDASMNILDDFLRMDWFRSAQSSNSQSLFQHHSSTASNLWLSAFLREGQ